MHACGRIKPEALLAWIDRATLAIQDLRELWEPACWRTRSGIRH